MTFVKVEHCEHALSRNWEIVVYWRVVEFSVCQNMTTYGNADVFSCILRIRHLNLLKLIAALLGLKHSYRRKRSDDDNDDLPCFMGLFAASANFSAASPNPFFYRLLAAKPQFSRLAVGLL